MNRKNHLKLKSAGLVLFFVLVGASAICQDEYYIPKALIIPVHTYQQELHVSLGVGGGYDGNLSYAFTKHFAIFTTGTLSKATSGRRGLLGDKYYIQKNDYALKGGVGYFTAINSKVFNYIESYAGFGKYKVDNYRYFPDEQYTGSGYTTRAGFKNVFWQIQATQKRPTYELTMALRLSYSIYQYLEYQSLYVTGYSPPVQLPGVKGLTIDPAVSYSYLVNKLKFNLQLGASAFTKTTTIKSGNGSTVGLRPGAPIGRISVQYNFDFRNHSK